MNKASKQISKALLSINPNFSFVIEGGKIVTWYTDDPKPTEEEIVQKVAELEYQEEVNEYQRQRAREYPPVIEQQDMKFHDDVNGTTVWRDTIQAVKDKYPKQTMDINELQTRKDQAIFDLQTKRYLKSIERLSQYVLSEGRSEIREDVVVETKEVYNEETHEFETVNVTENVVTQTAIDPLEATVEVYNEETEEIETVPNPLIVKDEEERAAAQAVIDATPQAVIDAINS